jgi:SecD/SecF fusion protein
MRRTQAWLTAMVIFFTLASLWYLYPSIRLWTMSPEKVKAGSEADPIGFAKLQKQAIKLGLDLRGGLYVLMEVDKSKLKPEEAADAVDRALEVIRNRVDQFGVTEPVIQKAGSDKIVVELAGLQDVDRARELIGRTAQLEFKLTENPDNVKSLMTQLDQIIARKYGTGASSKPESSPEKKETPNEAPKDTSDLFKTLFGGDTGQKGSDTLPQPEAGEGLSVLLQPVGEGFSFGVEENDVPLVKRYLSDPEIRAAVPPDVQIAWSTGPVSSGGFNYPKGVYFLKRQVELSGEHLTDARPTRDNFGKWVVSFNLDRRGGQIFSAVTGANVGKPLAIVLDSLVESAPIIQSRIRDRGQIELGSVSTLEAARDLSIVLRAGALPAPVRIVENRVIGPSLGKDSIKKGLTSAIIGGILVILFIAVYYRISGVIADFALLLNVLFLMAILAAFNATLTLPGIAGLILSMGMSVDSNVLIFERMREELKTGKTIRASIDAGYTRALLTIIDSHVTTLITALVLFLFGTGPIKGFAVTLTAGIIISLFTAVVITRLIFNYRKQYSSLSI